MQLTRGAANDALTESTKYSNFCMLFGTKPAKFVLLETKMVENLLDHLMLKRDVVRKTVPFPRVLDQMKSDDANFELSVSNSIQKLILYHRSSAYKHSYKNVVGKSIGMIFINNGTHGLPYN